MKKSAGRDACDSERERTGEGEQCRLTLMQQENAIQETHL